MLIQCTNQRGALIERNTTRGNTEVSQALAADAKRQRIFKRLKACEEAVRLDPTRVQGFVDAARGSAR